MKQLFIIVLFFIIFLNLPLAQQKEEQEKTEQVVYVVSLKGEIFEGLATRVKQKINRIDKNKAKLVIIEIDTPGGVVAYIFDICKQINALAESGIPVYAYIEEHAWSGGALISLACDKIYMNPKGSIGSAQVKILTPFGVKDADEKTMSAMKAQFRSYAEKGSYPVRLSEAMVDPSIKVMEVHYKGERFFKTNQDILEMRNDKKIDPSRIEERKIVVDAGKLANFTAKESKEYGFCREIYNNRKELLKDTGYDDLDVIELDITTEDSIANFLSNKWVRFFLISLGILGILIEFWTPGFGIFGIIGITCFALFFLGGYLGEVTEIWQILLFIIGLVLLAVEIFIIPGFGVVGITGIVLCFFALLMSFQNFILPSNEQESNIFMMNIFMVTFSVGLDILLMFIIIKFLPESAPLRRLSLSEIQRSEDGYCVAINSYLELLGKEGVAISMLRPAGRIDIEGEQYDAISQGEFINKDEKIKVILVQGNKIIINKA